MKEIPLTQGKVSLVDDEDFDWLSKKKWTHTFYGYASTSRKLPSGKWSNILMHRLITECPPKMEVDHINMDKLDNRRENLRICTPSENKMNIGLKKNNQSGFKGVSWSRRAKKWQAAIGLNKVHHHLGWFDSKEEAIEAYRKKARELHGDFLRLE